MLETRTWSEKFLQFLHEPFFPPDKPKSWSLAGTTFLAALSAAGIMFLAYHMNWPGLFEQARAFAMFFGILFNLIANFFVIRTLLGHYKGIKPSSWKDRPW